MTLKLNSAVSKNPVASLIYGLVLGAILVLGIRFATYAPEHIHYHANFAVYINGQQELFKEPRYYQEVAICSKGRGITVPEARVHLHDNDNSAIHVHDHAVTWGQFFNNLGWNIGSDFIQTADSTMYRADGTNKLHIFINNQDYTDLTNLANTVIKDKDRLLISYGNQDDATLLKEAKAVSSSAAKYDVSKDPASCAGAETVTLHDRLKHLF
ncbi:MAG: hypothetical protein QFB87_01190 [Patescibacteria group bacterium]|nr:hypothetical protein [Patescibacteria group bacterium]